MEYFQKAICKTSCKIVNSLLTSIKSTGYDLRNRSHGCASLSDDDPLSRRQKFINRMLTNNYSIITLNFDMLCFFLFRGQPILELCSIYINFLIFS